MRFGLDCGAVMYALLATLGMVVAEGDPPWIYRDLPIRPPLPNGVHASESGL